MSKRMQTQMNDAGEPLTRFTAKKKKPFEYQRHKVSAKQNPKVENTRVRILFVAQKPTWARVVLGGYWGRGREGGTNKQH